MLVHTCRLISGFGRTSALISPSDFSVSEPASDKASRTSGESSVLEVSVHIAATRETVFSYFTDASRCVQWMGTSATLDPVPSGVYRVEVSLEEEDGGTRVVLRHHDLPDDEQRA